MSVPAAFARPPDHPLGRLRDDVCDTDAEAPGMTFDNNDHDGGARPRDDVGRAAEPDGAAGEPNAVAAEPDARSVDTDSPAAGQSPWPPAQSAWPPQSPGPAPSPWGTPYQPSPGWGSPPAPPALNGPPPGYPPSWNAPPPVYAPDGSGFGPDGWQPGAARTPRRSRLPQTLAVLAAVLVAFGGGMTTNALLASNGAGDTSANLKGFDVYQQAVSIVKDDFVGRSSVSDQQLVYGSIEGLVNSLGDTGHSVFLTPQQYQAQQSQLSGTFAGIGVVGTDTNGVPAVQRVLPGSPAEKAGVRAGDQITAVNGQSTSGLTFSDLASKIRGPAGTDVTLTVIHSGATTPAVIKITRQIISNPTVEWGMVPGTHVADISIAEFSTGASKQLATVLAAAARQGATAIVLDLRANPGGYVSEAQGVLGQFIGGGVAYIQQDAQGHRSEVKATASGTPTKLPLVVLVDHDSASASEIVAGALQDSKRAQVVGVKTFGTGTVLLPFPLKDGSVIYLGVEEWLTPAGHRIFGNGITPNQTVAMPPGVPPTDPADLSALSAAQVQASKDADLLAALKLLGQ